MGFLEKGVLIYLIIAVVMCFAEPAVIFGNSQNAIGTSNGIIESPLSWFSIGLVNGTPVFLDQQNCSGSSGYCLTGAASNPASNITSTNPIPTGTTILGFVDPLFEVWDWITTFFRIIFSPAIVTNHLVTDGAPPAVFWFFGLPLTALFIVAIIMFIRNGLTAV